VTLVDDLQLLLGLAQELWRDDPRDVQCTFGRIAWWSANIPRGESETRLWFDGEQLVGWGWVTGGTELEFQVRPTHREVLDEILAWASPDELMVLSDDAGAIARIEANGLVHVPSAPWMRLNARALDDLPEPVLPEGYSLRTVREDDFASRAAAHRSAFRPSRFRDEVYAFVRATPPYRADLDCVAIAPDGTVAAYTLAWLDDVNRLGQFEPVGTHADHQRRGLGRAVNLFALHRLREEGATLALVECRGDAEYPIPAKLYESAGFREVSRQLAYRRPG
jgi:ribosomal protein S18 acetylase RimI-like enzyme